MKTISSYQKYAFLLTTLLLLYAVTMMSLEKTAASPQGSFLTTTQISDHALTGEDVSTYSMQMKASSNAAHIIWQEQNLAGTNTDLFYRQLPNGTTQRISDVADTDGNVITFPTLQVSSAGIPHAIWEEVTGTAESRDLYYWNANEGAQRLTDRTATQGDVVFGSKHLWLEDNGEAHVVWQELNSSQTENIYFYWTSISGNVQQLPGYEASVIKDGVLHVVWEASQTGPVQYWNSSSQVTVSLPNSTATGDVSVQQKGIFAQGPGAITIFFGKNYVGDATTDCLVEWNSSTQNSTTRVTGEQCFSLNHVAQDDNGVFHAFGVDSDSATLMFLPFYWNSGLSSPIFFDSSGAGTGSGIPSASLYVAENGKAHILWQDDHNFYYWNPTDQQILNLSEPLGPGTFISPPQFSFIDQNGELNLIWVEAGQPNYWNASEKITHNLLTKLNMSSISYQFLSSNANPTEQDPVYLFQGTPNGGASGLFYWDVTADNLVPVWEGAIEPSIVQFVKGSHAEVFIGWIENSAFLFHLYSSSEGISIMNTTTAAENNLLFSLALDDLNNIYTTWTETSDTVGEGGDYFAAWPTEFNEALTKLYLPLLTR